MVRLRNAVFLLCPMMVACIGPTTPDGTPNKLAMRGDVVYAALAAGGVAIVERDSDRTIGTLNIPEGASRADDLTVAKDALFVLDGEEGLIWSYDLADRRAPKLISSPVEVPVGPFSGVAAKEDKLIVSGGTSELTVHRIDGAAIGARLSQLDLDRGQPDVELHDDGKIAIVSTHFEDSRDGADFGVTSLTIGADGIATAVQRAGLSGAGFTEGLGAPSNFPIQSAFKGRDLFVAHGGGVTRLETDDRGGMRVEATLVIGAEATAIAIDGDSAFVAGAGDTPKIVEIDLSGGGMSIKRTIDLGEDVVPLDVLAGGQTILVASFGRELARFAK